MPDPLTWQRRSQRKARPPTPMSSTPKTRRRSGSVATMLEPLDDSFLDLVDPKYSDTDGRWVGTSGRVRVFVYNTGTDCLCRKRSINHRSGLDGPDRNCTH